MRDTYEDIPLIGRFFNRLFPCHRWDQLAEGARRKLMRIGRSEVPLMQFLGKVQARAMMAYRINRTALAKKAEGEQMILTDATHALVGAKAFADLPEYSCSIPTHPKVGFRWKRRIPFQDLTPAELALGHSYTWWLGEILPPDGKCDCTSCRRARIDAARGTGPSDYQECAVIIWREIIQA